jgi:hypothetical protein
MPNIDELRKRIANGEVKPGGSGGGSKVGEGTFVCLVTEGTFGPGENTKMRGKLVCKVLSGGTDQEVGGTFNIYEQTVNEKYLESSIALWQKVLTENGVSEDKIFEDAENYAEIMGNCMVLAGKLATRGKLRLVIKRKDSGSKNSKGGVQYYNDILLDETIALLKPETEAAPAAEAPAPAAAPAAPAAEAPKKKKAWE